MTSRLTTAGICKVNGKFLIAKRSPGGPLGGMWEFVGGKNRYSESAEETLIREWKEELGVDIKVGKYLTETTFINEDVYYTLKCYEVSLLTNNITLSVHDDVKWVSKDELNSFSFGPSDDTLKNYVLENM